MASCILYLASTVTDWFLYECHVSLCKQLYKPVDLPEPVENPIQVFEHCLMSLGCWIVFMVWLETCPNAFATFQELRRQYPLPSLTTVMDLL